MSIVDPATGAVTVVHLNPHINYAVTPGPPSEIALSLAQPTDVRFLPDGRQGLRRGAGLEQGRRARRHDRRRHGAHCRGPGAGRARAGRGRRSALYVLNRFDTSISIVATATDQVIVTVPVGFDPTPASIRAGRLFLYDAARTSGHGDASCASCHAFANFDDLAWDLGNPQGNYADPPPNQIAGRAAPGLPPDEGPDDRRRRCAASATSGSCTGAPTARASSRSTARSSALMGRSDSLSAMEMQGYSDFIETVRFGPNPNRNLDRSLPNPAVRPERGARRERVHERGARRPVHVQRLPHRADRDEQPGRPERDPARGPGHEGPATAQRLREEPHVARAGQRQPRGLRLHARRRDGQPGRLPAACRCSSSPAATRSARDVEAFVLAFDTGTAPAVGRRITLGSANRDLASTGAVLDTLYARAAAGDCDLVVLGRSGGLRRGWLYAPASARLRQRPRARRRACPPPRCARSPRTAPS